jgi:anthranilate phosphoribosyltransferase
VVNAHDGLDELSTIGPTRVSELRDGRISTWTLDPAKLGLSYARLSDLQVSSVEEAADMLRMVMQGTMGPMRDIALLNAAAGLVIAGKSRDLKDGLVVAADAVDSGRAQRTLEALIRASKE